MSFPITDGRPCIRSRGSTHSQAENDLSDQIAAAELAIIREIRGRGSSRLCYVLQYELASWGSLSSMKRRSLATSSVSN